MNYAVQNYDTEVPQIRNLATLEDRLSNARQIARDLRQRLEQLNSRFNGPQPSAVEPLAQAGNTADRGIVENYHSQVDDLDRILSQLHNLCTGIEGA